MKIYDIDFERIAIYQKKNRPEEAAKARAELLEQVEALKVGDQVQLGAYELPGGCKPNSVSVSMPIFWYVLHREGTKLLLLSSYCVDWSFYDGSAPLLGPAADTQWHRCDIRAWLNGDFYNSAFRDYEKGMILETELRTENNGEYRTEGGAATRDRLFLLSAREAGLYLKNRDLAAGEYLFADSSLHEERTAELSVELCSWWLRTPGGTQNRVAVMREDGSVDLCGIHSDADEVGIRPAMWVDVSRFG